jgi:hypothetical protein
MMEIVEFHWKRDFWLSIANLTPPWALRRPPQFLVLPGRLWSWRAPSPWRSRSFSES